MRQYINGVVIYPLTDEALNKALINPNSVILLASLNDVFTPTHYQRYADYIDKTSLQRAGFIEALTPYVIDSTKYPISSNFNYLYNLFDTEDRIS